MRNVILFIALTYAFAGVTAEVARSTAKIPEGSPVVHGRPLYKFSYAVRDPKTGDHKSALEERDGDLTKGYYSLLQPDGIVRTVVYASTPITGFRAHVSNTPGPVIQPIILNDVGLGGLLGNVNLNPKIVPSPQLPAGPPIIHGRPAPGAHPPPPPPPPPPPASSPVPNHPPASAIGHGRPVLIPLSGGRDIGHILSGHGGFRPIVGPPPHHPYSHGPRGPQGIPIIRGAGGPIIIRPGVPLHILRGRLPVVGPVNTESFVGGIRGVGQPFTLGNWAGGVSGVGHWGGRGFGGPGGPPVAGHLVQSGPIARHLVPAPILAGRGGVGPLIGPAGHPGVWHRGYAPLSGRDLPGPVLLRGPHGPVVAGNWIPGVGGSPLGVIGPVRFPGANVGLPGSPRGLRLGNKVLS